jgi:hypothetical protein
VIADAPKDGRDGERGAAASVATTDPSLDTASWLDWLKAGIGAVNAMAATHPLKANEACFMVRTPPEKFA